MTYCAGKGIVLKSNRMVVYRYSCEIPNFIADYSFDDFITQDTYRPRHLLTDGVLKVMYPTESGINEDIMTAGDVMPRMTHTSKYKKFQTQVMGDSVYGYCIVPATTSKLVDQTINLEADAEYTLSEGIVYVVSDDYFINGVKKDVPFLYAAENETIVIKSTKPTKITTIRSILL